jgi:hypothetical protein
MVLTYLLQPRGGHVIAILAHPGMDASAAINQPHLNVVGWFQDLGCFPPVYRSNERSRKPPLHVVLLSTPTLFSQFT